MDSTSQIVEKVLETKKETEELNVDVMASEENDNTPKTPSESNTDSDLGKPQSQTSDKGDADLTTGDKLESKDGSSESEITADIAVTPPSTTGTLIEKRSSSIGSLDAEEEEEEEEGEEKEEDLPVKADTTNISEMDKEENQKLAVIDDNTISVSTSNARKPSVPQDSSNAQIKGEDEEVQSTEETVLKDSTESLTGKDPVESTSNSSALTGESTKSEVDLPIEHAKDSEELENRSDRSDANKDKESQEMADQSELLDKKTKENEHPKTDQRKDFNNQILDIISDIDINIKAQEKITQLKEQELELIKKQNELANQIHQQQILAQQLSAQNRFKQSQQSQSGTLDPQSHHQTERDLSAPIFNQKNTVVRETSNVSKTVDLRKIFTPATDSSEILPKNHYQQYHQKPAISPNILPAYSDAGKHRVQLNIHQNQLIEKYSKPGLQVVQSPWEAALQTGSASSAFLEDNKGQCFSPTVSPTPYFHGGNIDLRDAVESTHNNAQNQYTNDNASSPQSTNVRSNPQRDLAYTPCVAQGWGGRNVELPKGLYVPKELSLSSYAAPPKQYGGPEQPFNLQNYESTRSLPTANFISNENPTTGRNEFPLSKPLKSGFSTLPPKQQLYAPTSYQRKPVGSESIAPQVNFNPTPLSFDKLARYEQHDKKNLTGPNPHYLNVQQSSYVRNTSPIPFGIASNEQTSRSPSSIGSMGSPYCHLPTTGPSKCGPLTSSSASPTLNQGQTFNKCARGWGATQNNQQPYQSTYSLPVAGNLPYSDF
ncbi:uncharacterized protein LOC108145281 isoform X5 [Drosophila elegans]|uniref:uncharacterized protein LOC108145281 isoform X5 n=1 Tax=Drosophila elegans TaxID=30023 RepID=UPI0007E71F83|nr:uncharacterized protein LOC108145281 isoform X5 [Drosophila elegans]